jgi:hypothetical protein
MKAAFFSGIAVAVDDGQLLASFARTQISSPTTAKGNSMAQYFTIAPKMSKPIRAAPPPPEFFLAIAIPF